jgi:hypothetical protein
MYRSSSTSIFPAEYPGIWKIGQATGGKEVSHNRGGPFEVAGDRGGRGGFGVLSVFMNVGLRVSQKSGLINPCHLYLARDF